MNKKPGMRVIKASTSKETIVLNCHLEDEEKSDSFFKYSALVIKISDFIIFRYSPEYEILEIFSESVNDRILCSEEIYHQIMDDLLDS